MNTFLRVLALLATCLGAWQSYKAMGVPVVRGGKRWYLQADGTYRRWWGSRAITKSELDSLPQG